MTHLWEVDHSYRCETDSGYDIPRSEFKSFAEFLEEFGDSDFDYNLMFRWDWHEGSDYDLPDFNGDVNYRNGELQIHWMAQRKGFHFVSLIEVCRADEPAVVAFLRPRLTHLVALWEPLVEGAQP